MFVYTVVNRRQAANSRVVWMFLQPLQQSLDFRRRGSRGHLFVVGSLDKHIQNEKELIRPRRLCLRRELPCSKVVQFCLRRKLPVPGTKI